MAKRSAPGPTKVGNKAPVLPVRDTVHFPGVIQTLLIGREMSVRALHQALRKNREVVVVGQQDQTVDEPRASELYRVGTLSEVLHVLPLPDGTLRVVLRGLSRIKIERLSYRSGSFTAWHRTLKDIPASGDSVDALVRECVST